MRGFRLYPKNLFTLVALYHILSIERVRPTEKTTVSQQPPKSSILAMIELLLQDIKDPKTLALRAGTILLGVLSYWVVAYQTEILEGFKNLSTETIMQKQEQLREKQFPAQQRQEAISVLTQLNQNQVIIWEYEPQFLNNFISIRASEGVLPVKIDQLNNYSVDKSSVAYINHLQDKSLQGAFSVVDDLSQQPLPVPVQYFEAAGQAYFYQAPLYDLSGVYSGVILVLWQQAPKITQQLKGSELVQHFNSRIQQSRRSLERQK